MLKHLELSDPNSCLNRANDDEMLFVLLGRDRAAPDAVRAWIHERIGTGKNEGGDAQILEAYEWIDKVKELQSRGEARGNGYDLLGPTRSPKLYVQAEQNVYALVGRENEPSSLCIELNTALAHMEGFKPKPGVVYCLTIRPVIGDELTALEAVDSSIADVRSQFQPREATPIASDETVQDAS
jgi:hypothetical protein